MITDDQIIVGCRRLERKYQKMLLERYASYLFTIANRYLNNRQKAEDALQEAWIKVFNHIDQYKEGTNLKSWLSKIMINVALRAIEKERSTDEITDNMIEHHTSQLLSIEDKMSYDDLLNEVNKLKSPSREVFIMYVIDGLPHKEIAEIMQIESSTSRVYLANARKALTKALIHANSIIEK